MVSETRRCTKCDQDVTREEWMDHDRAHRRESTVQSLTAERTEHDLLRQIAGSTSGTRRRLGWVLLLAAVVVVLLIRASNGV